MVGVTVAYVVEQIGKILLKSNFSFSKTLKILGGRKVFRISMDYFSHMLGLGKEAGRFTLKNSWHFLNFL